jgi:hypothetical protein
MWCRVPAFPSLMEHLASLERHASAFFTLPKSFPQENSSWAAQVYLFDGHLVLVEELFSPLACMVGGRLLRLFGSCHS